MKIIYTAKEVNGRWAAHSRIAKDTLVAIIEDDLLKSGQVTSYSIIKNHQFPFPH